MFLLVSGKILLQSKLEKWGSVPYSCSHHFMEGGVESGKMEGHCWQKLRSIGRGLRMGCFDLFLLELNVGNIFEHCLVINKPGRATGWPKTPWITSCDLFKCHPVPRDLDGVSRLSRALSPNWGTGGKGIEQRAPKNCNLAAGGSLQGSLL